MCYEYDWMQPPQADEEFRKAQEHADLIRAQGTTPPPEPAEPAPVAEPAPA